MKLVEPKIQVIYPTMKEGSSLIWNDTDYSPMERRSQDSMYAFSLATLPEEMQLDEKGRGTKRARAEDFL